MSYVGKSDLWCIMEILNKHRNDKLKEERSAANIEEIGSIDALMRRVGIAILRSGGRLTDIELSKKYPFLWKRQQYITQPNGDEKL